MPNGKFEAYGYRLNVCDYWRSHDRIVAEGQENNIGLEYNHGETIVQHGVKTNQLKESVTLMAFAGEYS